MKINSQTRQELKHIIREKIAAERKHIVVISASELTKEQKEMVEHKLINAAGADISYKHDPSLIAGVIIKQGSQVVDLSLQGKLQSLEHFVYDNT